MAFAAVALSALCLVPLQGDEASATVVVTDDPVLFWNQVMVQNYSGSPITTSRGVAMVEVALHDAVNAALGSPNASYLQGVATSGGDVRAAATQAAFEVLSVLNPAAAANLAAARDASLALVPDGQAKADGIATGSAIAQAVIALRTGDGSTTPGTYTPTNPAEPGHWQPTPPANAAPLGTNWAGVDPWMMSSGNQFRASPPPDINSAEYAAALAEVKAIGAANSGLRDADMTESALFWAQTPGANAWVQLGIDAALQDASRTTLENAMMLAQLGVAGADATIGIFDSKYFYDLWRPVTAIRNAETVASIAALDDDSWLPFITTPAHPSYVSGHSAQSAAMATILQTHLGVVPISFTSTGPGGVITREWASFEDAANDAAMSRLWGGIHYRFDNDAGLTMGRSVAQYVLGQYQFRAVPEPATWAVMLVGFGALGGAMRTGRWRGKRLAVPALA
ncbi:MAG TPA: PEPxxWA-CTERM sorting domain-containing protein [Croceibacterium sp.]|nr:PEPxxWA-CTERM sorting domain-containing protein [Croceibacterium sp.]